MQEQAKEVETVKTYLAFDPSSTATGWAYVRWNGKKLAYLTCGVIVPPKFHNLPSDERLARRIRVLHHKAGALIGELYPAVIGVESPFSSPQMARSGMILSSVRTAMQLTAPDIRWVEYTPTNVKLWASGKGNADKDAVRAGAIERWRSMGLKLDAGMGYDAADALAVLGLLCEGEGLLKGGE